MKRLLLTLGFIAFASIAQGQGTVNMRNTAGSRVQLLDAQSGTTAPVPASISINYGLFVNGSTVPVMPLATSSTTAGLIQAPLPYVIPSVTPNQPIPAQVRGWAAEFGADWEAAKTLGAVYAKRMFGLSSPITWKHLARSSGNQPPAPAATDSTR
jgi:hypothetical protein